MFIAVSLDGFVAGADDSLDFLSRFEKSGEDYGFAAFFASVDAMVVGRRTYDVVRGFETWPYGDKRIVVLTHRAAEPRHGETFFTGEPGALVDSLAREGVRRVYVDGPKVIRQFLAAGLIDDLTLSVIPVVLGGGIPLFGEGAGPERWLALEGTQSWPSGLVQLRYRVEAAKG